ncbi:MAG TPA: hypothetical protein VKT82_07425 [Ktedonobacterales bacterium]|nr:hypothetical protein [Ktedonobacterales bacterium]
MRRFARLPSRRLFVAWLLCLCVTLLVGLSLVSLAQPQHAGAAARPFAVTPTPTHAAHATATPHSGTAGSTGQTTHADKAPSWLGEGLLVVFLFLLGLSLILFPIVVRSSRIERSRRLEFSPMPVPEAKQAARFSQIAPERKEPLSRDQWQALHEAAREKAGPAPHATAHLAAMRVVDGVPVSLPSAEAEAVPQLPAPSLSLAHDAIESHAPEAEAALDNHR